MHSANFSKFDEMPQNLQNVGNSAQLRKISQIPQNFTNFVNFRNFRKISQIPQNFANSAKSRKIRKIAQKNRQHYTTKSSAGQRKKIRGDFRPTFGIRTGVKQLKPQSVAVGEKPKPG